MNYWELFIAGTVVGYSVALLLQLQHRRRHRNEERQVRRVISAYFKTQGLQANVSCVHSARGFFTLVECDASRKARFSGIREVALLEHVKKVIDKDLNGVHWRFRLSPAAAAAADDSVDGEIQNYPDGAAPPRQKDENFDVNVISWDNYESVLRTGADAQMEAGVDARHALSFRMST
ncbi:MAG: hypothetical protein H0V78_14550 [Burkholderiales bacterium]|nr:hypothetical protein [Burkholderiales bacterium]